MRVCLAGISGWTGQALAPAIAGAPDLQLVGGVARSAAGRPISSVAAVQVAGLVHGTVDEALSASGVDVLIDYTSAAAVRGNVEAAIAAGVHVVVGSSGLTAGDYRELDARARSRGVGVIASGNFSIMAAVLQQAAVLAAQHLEWWEIVDYASETKPDVPSGTARELAEILAEVRAPRPAVRPPALLGPGEARGADVSGTHVHSLRLPSFVVSTELVFGGAGERLTFRHDPGATADPYIEGTLLAVRRVGETRGVTRGLRALLFDAPAAQP